MKRTTLLACLATLVCGIFLISCSADSDTEVYLLEDIWESEGLTPPDQVEIPELAAEDDLDSQLKKFLPTGYVPYYDSTGKQKGYYGYVDLGLSTKWAVCDVGVDAMEKTSSQTYKKFADFYKEEIERIYLEYVEYLGYDEGRTSMTLEEYKNYVKKGDRTISALWKYNYDDAYDLAVSKYQRYLLTTKYAFLFKEGEDVRFGSNGLVGSFVQYDDIPTDYSGNVSYDAATNLWGTYWRTPTKVQMGELVSECTAESENWYSKNYSSSSDYWSYSGISITGPSGAAIFISGSYSNLLTSTKDESREYWDNIYLGYVSYGSLSLRTEYYTSTGYRLRPVCK